MWPTRSGAAEAPRAVLDDRVVAMGGTADESLIPEARVDDLDLDDDTDAATWDARMDARPKPREEFSFLCKGLTPWNRLARR